jgi:putative ABC transport system substrate-binding protein
MISRRQILGALALLGGVAAIWPMDAQAQPSTKPVVGFLHHGTLNGFAPNVAAFHEGMAESGFIDGRNVAVEYRWAEGRYERMSELAADLVRRRVAVIAADGTAAARAAKAATSEISVVFMVGRDPVELGLVSSLSRPGGNATGVTMFNIALAAKRFELLREIVPRAVKFALLVNPRNVNWPSYARELEDAMRGGREQLILLKASADAEFVRAFDALARDRADALIVAVDPFFDSRRDQLVAMAARHAVPAIYGWREFAAAGGLISYGTEYTNMSRQVGVYTGRILKGAKPADLPVEQPTRFELVVNLRTAKALGIVIPQPILLRADEVIE